MRSLKKTDLLQIIEDQKNEMELVRSHIEKIRLRLEQKELVMETPGDIMKSALQINELFRSAQKESKKSLDQIKAMEEQQNKSLQLKENAVINWCEVKQEETRQICTTMWEETRQKCSALERETKEKCERMEENAKTEVEKRWTEISDRLQAFYEAHKELREFIATTDEGQNIQI